MAHMILRVELVIDLRNGVTEGYDEDFGGPTLISHNGGCVTSAQNDDFIDHIKEMLIEQTDIDDTILWKVSDVRSL